MKSLVFVLLFFAAAAHAQEFLTPGDNLVVEGLPQVPVALADELNRYTEMRAASLSSWHPKRREMLVITRLAEAEQVHHLKFPGGARTQLTFLRDGVNATSFQPTHGDYLIYSAGVGGNENYQFYRYDFDSGQITLLTDGKSRNTEGTWSNNGNLLAYGSTRRTGKDVDIWVIDPADPKSDRMLAEMKGGGWTALDFSPDDKQLIVGEYISVNQSYLWLIDVATGKRTLLTPKDEKEKIVYGNAKFARDRKGIYVVTDRDSEFRRLAHIDLETKEHTYLTDNIKWDIQEGFALSWDGKTIAFISNEDGLSVLHLLDTASGKVKPAPTLPVGVAGGMEWHKNDRDLGITMSSARDPSEAYSIDVESGKIDRWTFSETGGINTQKFVVPTIVRWKSFDGREISGWLYSPPPDKFPGTRPVVVSIHGGPEGQSRPMFGAMSGYLVNEMGVAIIRPNIRGSTGYGKTFVTLDNGFKREDSYKDINALFDWIQTRKDLDAERIMVTGGSYGGHMTLAISTYYPQRIKCALAIVGMANLVTFLENTSGYRQDLRRVEYGDERDPKMREFLNKIAPANNAAKIRSPLFVVQGANDPRVPLSEAVQMVEVVRKNNTPVWYLMAKDEGHGFAKKKNEDFLMYATVLFIREHLLK
jgi:dipeptidyl aminopeptidase/acylaminoacyl peptidase